jgi:hypothetical protein
MRIFHTLLWTSEREAVFDDPNRFVRRGEVSLRSREERL